MTFLNNMMTINESSRCTAETRQTIRAMCQQESTGYKTCDFLYEGEPSSSTSATRTCGGLNISIDAIDVDCRTKMVAWCYQVVDFCRFHRETVAIAINLLDRFVATPTAAATAAKADRKRYQLAAMTSLYTAVKIHEPEAMDPKLVSTLSRGTYQPHEIEAMEKQILDALTWRVNPPTAMAFVRQYMTLISNSTSSAVPALDEYTEATIHDLTKFQTELAVSEYDFLGVRPSVLAFCAFMNSLESVGILEGPSLESIASLLSLAIGLEGDVSEMQMWLYQAVVQEPAARNMLAIASAPIKSAEQKTSSSPTLSRQRSCEISPRSIAA